MANATMSTTPDDAPTPDALAAHADELRIVRTRPLRGPNVADRAPVVVAELRAGTLAAHPPASLADVAARLLAAIPALGAEEPGSWGDALVRVARELQRMSGSPATVARVMEDRSADGGWTVALGYDEEVLATDALHEAARILRDCLRGDDPEIDDTVARLQRRYDRSRPGPTSMVMIEAARRRGIPVRRDPDSSMVQLGLGATGRRMKSTMTDFTSVIATTITSDKHWTKTVLERVGLATPGGGTAGTLDEALEVAEQVGFPLLLKPLDANNGRGISGRIDTMQGVRDAWPIALAEHPTVVIERFAEGNDHRVVVVNKRVVACVERIPAHVVGDGVRTIRALAEAINLDPNRSKTNPSCSLAPLPLEERTERFIARSGYTLDSVPAAGERVFLRATANISTGGTAIDRTDEIHPVNRALCELAAGAVGLDIAGLDVLTPDIAVPFRENGAVVIEVNASPGIRMHTHPDNGIPRDVPGAIIDMLYPPGAPVTIPVLAVTGTDAKATTRLLAHLFRATGRKVGDATTDGVRFQDLLLLEGDLPGPHAANVVLSHPEVEVAVLETEREGILRSGLAFDECDVGVVLDVAAGPHDKGSQHGVDAVAQLAEVQAVVASVVKPTGHAVLSADDALVYAMRERTRGAVALFSTATDGASPRVEAHVAGGGTAALLEREEGEEVMVIRRGERRERLAAVREVPLTRDSADRVHIGSVLAASVAAYVQGMPVEAIRAGLLGAVQ
jgi:cyanophycin synthetase